MFKPLHQRLFNQIYQLFLLFSVLLVCCNNKSTSIEKLDTTKEKSPNGPDSDIEDKVTTIEMPNGLYNLSIKNQTVFIKQNNRPYHSFKFEHPIVRVYPHSTQNIVAIFSSPKGVSHNEKTKLFFLFLPQKENLELKKESSTGYFAIENALKTDFWSPDGKYAAFL